MCIHIYNYSRFPLNRHPFKRILSLTGHNLNTKLKNEHKLRNYATCQILSLQQKYMSEFYVKLL